MGGWGKGKHHAEIAAINTAMKGRGEGMIDPPESVALGVSQDVARNITDWPGTPQHAGVILKCLVS